MLAVYLYFTVSRLTHVPVTGTSAGLGRAAPGVTLENGESVVATKFTCAADMMFAFRSSPPTLLHIEIRIHRQAISWSTVRRPAALVPFS